MDDVGANGQLVEVMEIGGRKVEVDAEIAPIVRALNAAGVRTVASCSGHGRRPGIIALSDGREIIIARNFAEARRIDRLFPLGTGGEPVNAHEIIREAIGRCADAEFLGLHATPSKEERDDQKGDKK